MGNSLFLIIVLILLEIIDILVINLEVGILGCLDLESLRQGYYAWVGGEGY